MDVGTEGPYVHETPLLRDPRSAGNPASRCPDIQKERRVGAEEIVCHTTTKRSFIGMPVRVRGCQRGMARGPQKDGGEAGWRKQPNLLQEYLSLFDRRG